MHKGNIMRMEWIAGLAGLMLIAAVPSPAANSQQNKMTACNADASAKGLTGDDRKSFMKTCLSNTPAPAGNSQQQKMKTCNADATSKGLKGSDRKAFMKTCLSSSG